MALNACSSVGEKIHVCPAVLSSVLLVLFSVYLVLAVPPDIEYFPDQNIVENNSLDVTCNVTTFPASAYRWTRLNDAHVLSHSARLIIPNIQRNATGIYICAVEMIMKPTGETQKTTTTKGQITVTVLREYNIDKQN